jgi:hypothetical protein
LAERPGVQLAPRAFVGLEAIADVLQVLEDEHLAWLEAINEIERTLLLTTQAKIIQGNDLSLGRSTTVEKCRNAFTSVRFQNASWRQKISDPQIEHAFPNRRLIRGNGFAVAAFPEMFWERFKLTQTVLEKSAAGRRESGSCHDVSSFSTKPNVCQR